MPQSFLFDVPLGGRLHVFIATTPNHSVFMDLVNTETGVITPGTELDYSYQRMYRDRFDEFLAAFGLPIAEFNSHFGAVVNLPSIKNKDLS